MLLDARAQFGAKVAWLTDPDGWPDPEAVDEPPPPTEEPPEGCACALSRGPSGWLAILAPLARRRRRGA